VALLAVDEMRVARLSYTIEEVHRTMIEFFYMEMSGIVSLVDSGVNTRKVVAGASVICLVELPEKHQVEIIEEMLDQKLPTVLRSLVMEYAQRQSSSTAPFEPHSRFCANTVTNEPYEEATLHRHTITPFRHTITPLCASMATTRGSSPFSFFVDAPDRCTPLAFVPSQGSLEMHLQIVSSNLQDSCRMVKMDSFVFKHGTLFSLYGLQPPCDASLGMQFKVLEKYTSGLRFRFVLSAVPGEPFVKEGTKISVVLCQQRRLSLPV
jgi:hypothetical protein